jgi:hypothetical protein
MESMKFLTKVNRTVLVGISSYHNEYDYNPFIAEVQWSIHLDVKPYGIVGGYVSIESVKANVELVNYIASDEDMTKMEIEEMQINSKDGWKLIADINLSDLKNIGIEWVTFDFRSKTIIVE